ncbi:hypothetical protein CBL_06741 [Carabus blaptoides fortunei]
MSERLSFGGSVSWCAKVYIDARDTQASENKTTTKKSLFPLIIYHSQLPLLAGCNEYICLALHIRSAVDIGGANLYATNMPASQTMHSGSSSTVRLRSAAVYGDL